MKGPSGLVHLLTLVHPLVFPVFGVESTDLQPAQFESEARSELLKSSTFGLAVLFVDLVEDVSMVANKDKVSLVVESHDLSSFEVRFVREERS